METIPIGKLLIINRRITIPAGQDEEFIYTAPNGAIVQWRETTYETTTPENIWIKRLQIVPKGEVEVTDVLTGDNAVGIVEFAGDGKLPRLQTVILEIEGGRDIVITLRNKAATDQEVSLTLWFLLEKKK